MGDYREYQNRSLRNADSIANSLIAKRRYPGNYFLSFLLVEGETDKKLFEGFIEPTKCYISIAYGKEKAIEIVSILERSNFSGVLAIVDADFDILEAKYSNLLNLIFTDTHDIEIMMIEAPSFEKFLREYGSEEKISNFTRKFGHDIRSLIVERTLPIGYLRWISLRENLSFDFQKLEFGKFVNKDTLEVDVQKLIGILQARLRASGEVSKRHICTDKAIQEKIEQLASASHHHSQVCCGHDVVSLLSIGLRKALGSHNANSMDADHIEASLRLAFEQIHFEKTQLYSSIRDWEEANEPFSILKTNR